jgi:hypothetical protein
VKKESSGFGEPERDTDETAVLDRQSYMATVSEVEFVPEFLWH